MIKNIPTKSPPPFYFNPIFIGLILIVLITTYFVGKVLWTSQQTNKQEQEQEQEQEQNQEQNQVSTNIPLVSPTEVYRWIRNDQVDLIDIRSTQEFQIKHIESSKNIPLTEQNNIKQFLKALSPKKKNIIIDKTDTPSGKQLTKKLAAKGLDIAYLEGGILKYAQNNYPLVTWGDPKNTTDQIKVTTINAAGVKNKLLQGKIFSFIDTRPPYLFQAEKINGSLNFPLETIEENKEHLPTHVLLLYDADPLRAWRAGVKLYDMGLANFYVCTDPYTTLKQTLYSK